MSEDWCTLEGFGDKVQDMSSCLRKSLLVFSDVFLHQLKNFDKFTLEIQLVDKNWDSKRNLGVNRSKHHSKLEVGKQDTNVTKIYTVGLQQTIFYEEDNDENCLTYPTVTNFSDCDTEFLIKKLGPTLTTVFDSGNDSRVLKPEDQFFDYLLLDGMVSSDCRQPCSKTFASLKHVMLGKCQTSQVRQMPSLFLKMKCT